MEAFAGLKKMVTRGRRPRVFVVEVPVPSDEDSINNLSGSGNSSSVAMTTDGSGPTNLDILFDKAVAISSSMLSSAAGDSGGGGGGGGRNGAKAASGKGGGAGGEVQDEREPKADVGVLLRTIEEGVPSTGGVGPLEWDWLSCEEAAGRAKKLYREAAHAQVASGHHSPARADKGSEGANIFRIGPQKTANLHRVPLFKTFARKYLPALARAPSPLRSS